MYSTGVALLSTLGAALLTWLKNNRFKGHASTAERDKQDQTTWPDDLPRVPARRFLVKWLRTLGRKLALNRRKTASSEAASASVSPSGRKPISTIVAEAINYLYWPFVCSGLALTAWFCADLLFQLMLARATYQAIAEISAPVLAIVTPTAVGFWTNWLAVKMLFHPRRQNAVWWGLVPARRSELVDSIANGVMQQLISPEIVHAYLHQSAIVQDFVTRSAAALKETIDHPKFRLELKGVVYGLVYDFATSPQTRLSVEELVSTKIRDWTGGTVSEKIVEWTKALWGPKVLSQVVQALPELPKATDSVLARIDEYLDKVPDLMERESSRIEDAITKVIVEGLRNLNIRQVVKSQLDKMDEQALETMLTSNVTTELRFIQTSGGVFGFLAGLAFVYPASRPFLLACGAGLWFAYRMTVKKDSKNL